jgi:hypothetical protein
VKATLIIPDAAVAEEHGLETITELCCNEEYCATSFGYPVFQLPDGEIFDCSIFRELRDTCGATLETDDLVKVCLGLGLPKTEPGVIVVNN